ncbi:unnamed protein product [Sphagnum balticum]
MQILQKQAFFKKGRQDILPHCNDISDNEAQVEHKKKCLDLVFAVAVEAYECNIIHLNGEVAMAKLTAHHANSCIYMLTQEKEFGVLCTNFTVHNSISNYDCFIILKYGGISSGRKELS